MTHNGTIDELTTEMRESMVEVQVPEHLRGPLLRYITHGYRPGDFLVCVLRNSLFESIQSASPASYEGLPAVMRWLWWNAPARSWGSPDRVGKWIMNGGLNGELNR